MNYAFNEAFCKAFGKHLRTLRKSKNKGLRELARDAEIDYSQVYKIENAEINTTISTVYALAKALEIHPQELFSFELPKGADK